MIERGSDSRFWTLLLGALFLSGAVSVAGCTDAGLEPIPSVKTERDDELTVQGNLCTKSPETLVFPLRLLFIVDTSVSMQLTDPVDPMTGITGRERAVGDTWKRLLDKDAEGIRIGIIRFSSDAQSRTSKDNDGDSIPDTFFIGNRPRLQKATKALRNTGRTTNYRNALGEAYFELKTELDGAAKESLPLSKYVVIFLSDGIPDISSGAQRGDTASKIVGDVEELRELADSYDVGSFSFHTAFLSTGDSSFDEQAEDLLRAMAKEGDGNFRSFPNGEELNFLFADLTILRRAFTLKTLSAINLNMTNDRDQIPGPRPVLPDVGMGDVGMLDIGPAALDATGDAAIPREVPRPNPNAFVDLNGSSTVNCGEPMVDTDADGLADLTEKKAETDPRDPDTDDDALEDSLEWEIGDLDPKTPSKSECYKAQKCKDSNNDDKCDCIVDTNNDNVCDCKNDPLQQCVNNSGRDCVDKDEDGYCDCPNKNKDGECVFPDRDGDMLHDCEEVFSGTAQNGNDTDADGLPDLTEVRFKTNPAKLDLRGNLDSDQTINQIEVLANTNPRCDDSEFRSKVAYRYQLSSEGLSKARSCYDFEIDNITLVPTLKNKEEKYPGNGWNRILVYAGEVAFDDPSSFASYRVACIMASYNPEGNFKNPPSGRVKLSEDDFVEVRDFDPDKHCIWP